jgi:ribosomal-protein-alanine N-acetyltransferase
VRIRLAVAADLPRLMDLAAYAPTAAQWSRQHFEDALSGQSHRRALVLEDQTVLAFLVARAVDLEWELENIVVDPAARRRGIGTQLLREFLTRAQQAGGKTAFLEVRESNHDARALYEKNGFSQSGRRSHYYAAPSEDAILYRRSLL